MRARTILSTCIASLILAGQMAGAAEPAVALDIPAQSLGTALRQFAEQTGLQLVYETEIATGLRNPPVKGELTTREALQRLLDGTGLQFQFLSDHTVALTSPAPPKRSARELAPEPYVRLAQVATQDPAPISDRSGDQSAKLEDIPPSTIELEEIVVTGTHIRGTAPVGSQVFTFTREEIERTGYGTADQLIQSLPQNFGGGIAQDNNLILSGNTYAGTAVNLRGLGTDATLTLLNGRRLPIQGNSGDFVDISSIPLTAIERVEVMSDGASAIYGSDAIGGVANFILRKDFEGAETRLRGGSVTDGDAAEWRAGQTLGAVWESGHTLLTYEYYRRDNLASGDRAFAADSDLTRYGGDNFSDVRSNPGNINVPGVGTFAIPAGQDGTALTEAALIPGVTNWQNRREGVDLLPFQERHALFATLGQQVSERIAVFAEVRGGYREFEFQPQHQTARLTVPATNAFRQAGALFPGRTLQVDYDFTDDIGPRRDSGDVTTYAGTLGATVALGGTWQVETYGTYTRERGYRRVDTQHTPSITRALADSNPATAFNPFGDGSYTNPATLSLIGQGWATQTQHSTTWSFNTKADGSLFSLPAGDVKLAIGADYREEKFNGMGESFIATDTVTSLRALGGERRVAAAFGEMVIPVLRSLAISLAGRYEDYSDFGSSVDPKLGVQWSPTSALRLRASIGTSFKAPKLADIDESRTLIQVQRLTDPASPTGQSLGILLRGGNAELQEETATTWSAGIDFRPDAVKGFSAQLTYFDIDYQDRIDDPPSGFTVLQDEAFFAPLITRNPSADAVLRWFTDPRFQDVVGGTGPEDIAVIVDARLNNLATTQVRGVDLLLGYGLDTGLGRLDLSLNGSYLIDFIQAVTDASPTFEVVDTINRPIDLRLRAGATWSRRGLSASTFINYADGYMDTVSVPARRIDAFTTVDLQLRYAFQRNGGPLGDLSVALSAFNVLDEDPPFVNNPAGVAYDPDNVDPLGRLISLELTKGF